MLHENKTFTEPILKHLDLETSSLCNFNCNMCPRPKENGQMPIEDIKRIIKEFADQGGETIKPFWRGEPTLDERMPEILKYAKKCGLKTMLNSNCSFALGNMAQILEHTDWISLSIDSQHDNYSQIIFLAGLLNFRENINKSLYIEVQSCEYVKEIAMILNPYDIKYKVDEPTKRSAGDINSEVMTGERKYCGFPDWRLVVAYNGDCTMCCVDWKLENRVGNIYDNPLKDIFHGESSAYNLREDLKDNNFAYMSNICKQCPSRSAYV